MSTASTPAAAISANPPNTTPAVSVFPHSEAMRLAATETERLLALVDQLSDPDWSQRTDCTDWDVRDTVGHLVGMLEMQADPTERARQMTTAAEVAQRTGCLRLDAMTALQVREHAHLTPTQLRQAMHQAAPRALAARTAMTADQHAGAYVTGLPGEGPWTVGYLFDTILTRDQWLHRVDIARATGVDMALTADHDGVLIADVVGDWARRHGQPYRLTLTGPAGGTFAAGEDGATIEIEATQFARTLSGREAGAGLLATPVPF